MIYFYIRELFGDKYKRVVIMRVKETVFWSLKDQVAYRTAIRAAYPEWHHVIWTRKKWDVGKDKRSFSTHPGYANLIEKIGGHLDGTLRSRIDRPRASLLPDEDGLISARYVAFLTTRKAWKYHWAPGKGDANLHFHRRGRASLRIYLEPSSANDN